MTTTGRWPAVLHVVYNLIRGGTEAQCARAAMGLAGRGWRQRVAVSHREGYFLDRVEQQCGWAYEIRICRMLSVRTALDVLHLASFIRRERFDIVHCWDADAAIFGSLAAAIARVPFITSRRDLGQIYPAYKLRLMAWADRRARAVVVNATAIHDGLVRSGIPSQRVVRIPNILDIDEFDAQSRLPFSKASLLPAGRLILSVARLDPEKDVASLVVAFAAISGKHSDAFLVIAGDGPERAHLERLVDEEGVCDRVVFLGEVHEVPSLLTHGCIGALVPNSNEGLSNSILEYLAAGLPVLATDVGGNAELLREGRHGIVVPSGDAHTMAAALARMLEDAELRKTMGQAGRAMVEKEHQPGVVLAQLAELYCRVAAETRTGS